MPKISIIVPCYNVAPYVKECLDSLTEQTLRDIEILCIDDKSTDNTLEIIRLCAAADSRIQVIEQPKNGGQGLARNCAIRDAKGEYVLCVDADDMLTCDACEKLYARAKNNNLDMLMFSGYNFTQNPQNRIANPYWSFAWTDCLNGCEIFTYRDVIQCMTMLPVSACLTMYNLNFIKQHNILFPEGLRFEDNVFFLQALLNAKRISFDRTEYYVRRIHSESTTQNWDKHFADYIQIIDLILDYLITTQVDASIYRLYRSQYTQIAVNRFTGFNKPAKRRYKKQLRVLLNNYAPDLVHCTYLFRPCRLLKRYIFR